MRFFQKSLVAALRGCGAFCFPPFATVRFSDATNGCDAFNAEGMGTEGRERALLTVSKGDGRGKRNAPCASNATSAQNHTWCAHDIFKKQIWPGGVIDAGWEALRWPVCCSSLVYYSRVTAQKYGEHYLCMILGSVNNVALPFRNVVIGLKLSGQPTWISSPLTRFPHLS